MDRASKIIEYLGLIEHPEGGFFKETYRASEEMTAFQGKRNYATVIYFLLFTVFSIISNNPRRQALIIKM